MSIFSIGTSIVQKENRGEIGVSFFSRIISTELYKNLFDEHNQN